MDDADCKSERRIRIERGLFLVRNPSKDWLAHRLAGIMMQKPSRDLVGDDDLSPNAWRVLRVLGPTVAFGLVAWLGPIAVVAQDGRTAVVGGVLTLTVLFSRILAVVLGKRASSSAFTEELIFWAQAALWAPTLVLVSQEHGLVYLTLGLPMGFGTRILIHRLVRRSGSGSR